MTTPLTREQVEECIEGGDAEMFLRHDAALRLTLTKQAQEIERLSEERRDYSDQAGLWATKCRQLEQQLVTAQARVKELELDVTHRDRTIQEHIAKQQELQAALAECDQTIARLREALAPLASGENWGKWKAWVVEGALRREAGIEAAKHITQLQVAAQEALEPSPSPQGGDAPHRITFSVRALLTAGRILPESSAE